jgi:glyoxylase I family protein
MTEYNFLLHHASLIVSDTEAAKHFYCTILGLKQIPRPDLGFPGAWLALGSTQQLHLLELPNPDPKTGRPEHGGRDRHVALTVSSLDAVKALLTEHGITFTLSKSGRKALFCRDPDANAIEIIER